MRFLFLFLFLFNYINAGYAQNLTIYEDSIYNYIITDSKQRNKDISRALGNPNITDTLKLELYKLRQKEMEAKKDYWYVGKAIIDQGIILEHIGAESELILERFKTALEYSKKHKKNTNIVWASVRISKHYLNIGELNNPEELYYTNFVKEHINDRIDGEVRLLAYKHLANRQLRFYDFKTAIQYYSIAYELAKKGRHPYNAVDIAADILNVKNQYKDTVGVQNFVNEIMEFIAPQMKTIRGRFQLHLVDYENLFSVKERIEFLRLAELMLSEKGEGIDFNRIAYQKCKLALELNQLKDLEKHLNAFRKKLIRTPPTQQYYYLSQVEYLEGQLHILNKKYIEGISHLHLSLNVAKEIDAPVLFSDIYKALNNAYFLYGDYKNAYKYLDLFNKHEDKVFALNKVKEVENLLVLYETQRKEQTIENLKAKEQLTAEVVTEKTKFNRTLQLLLTLVSILSAILIYLYVLNRKKSKKLDKLNKVKDKVFSVLSHDLRSPLNTFKGLITISQRRQLSAEDYQKYLDVIQSEVLNTSNFLESILQWAQSNQNQLPINWKDIDINKLLSEVESQLAQELKAKNASFNVSCPDKLIVNSDKDLLSFIFRNIIFNALKFSGSSAIIKVNVSESTESTFVEICDNGPGMKPAQIQLFYDGNMEAGLDSTGEKSTGLGLQLCRDFAAKLHIQIKIESVINQGTIFKLEIPK